MSEASGGGDLGQVLSEMNPSEEPINPDITVENLKNIFASAHDVCFKNVFIKGKENLPVTLMYIEGMVNQELINNAILTPLSNSDWYDSAKDLGQAYNRMMNGGIHQLNVEETNQIDDVFNRLLSGFTIIIFDELKKAISLKTVGFQTRSISIAEEDETYKSPKSSFVENLRVNITLIRQIIRSHNLAVEETLVGRQSHTRVSIIYMKNICNDSFVSKVRDRINGISQDHVFSAKDIYNGVVDHKYTLFPQARNTEKPDVICWNLLEGRVAVLIDGVPLGLLFPTVFGDTMQTTADYHQNFTIATFFRLIKYVCLFFALLLPGVFIAMTEFHPEMLPYKLAISVAAAKSGTPFPTLLETIAMSTIFYALILASIQIPRRVGPTISIVGGLVLGEAAIVANLISAGVIVVVATAAICSITLPNKELATATWVWQMCINIFSALIGLWGVVGGIVLLLFNLARMESLGVPYLSPYAAPKTQMEDTFVLLPHGMRKFRPLYLRPKNRKRRS